MGRLPKHRLHAVLLALLVALGMGLAQAHGSLMAAETALAGEAGEPCPDGCDGCGDAARDLDADICLSVCASMALALLPDQPLTLRAAARADVQAGGLVLDGRCLTPEPGPPKPVDLV